MTTPTIGLVANVLDSLDLEAPLDIYGRVVVYLDGGLPSGADPDETMYTFISGDSTSVTGPQRSPRSSHVYTAPGVYLSQVDVVVDDGSTVDTDTTVFKVTVTYAPVVPDPISPEGMPAPRHAYVPLDPEHPAMIVKRVPR